MKAVNPFTSQISPKLVCATFLILSSVKCLLIPTYRSTDFDVHRNWLAITRHLPLSEWYFDDVGGTTVHTLDYPPLFAFFEWGLSNNFITDLLLEKGWLDERCLELLPDNDNEPSDRCVRFQRATVILSDVLLFLGAYLAPVSLGGVYSASINNGCGRRSHPWVTFLLIVTNPGLILLDHVHFQYNGMLLGVLLISISFIIWGTQLISAKITVNRTTDKSNPSDEAIELRSSGLFELLGAGAFAILMAMKHLYLMLAPLYLFYLLRHHCFVARRREDYFNYSFSFGRFIVLGIVTLICLLGAFVPFIMQNQPRVHMEQILARLFPFGRGLVHDYWAANVWALYLFTSRAASFLLRKAPIQSGLRQKIESYAIIPFSEPDPSTVAFCLLIGLIPCIISAWKVGGSSLSQPMTPSSRSSKTNAVDAAEYFIHAVAFSSFSGFMLGYHVHEKAIMTSIIPLSLLATTSRENARLFTRTCLFGIFGLLPLLFRTDELLLKVALFTSWMSGVIFILERIVFKNGKSGQREKGRGLLTAMDKLAVGVLVLLLTFMEIIHPIKFMPQGKYEFMPLMMTSVFCAMGLLHCWVKSFLQMMS